jgi:hypothetical protein
MRRIVTLAAVALGVSLFARAAPAGKRLPPGSWGGEHIELEVTESGATIEYDCAHGAIEGPLSIDAGGRFDVKGIHALEHGGPVRRDESPSERPARFTGRVEGETMNLRVRLDSGEEVGVFSLRRGGEPSLFKCR